MGEQERAMDMATATHLVHEREFGWERGLLAFIAVVAVEQLAGNTSVPSMTGHLII